MAWWLAYEELYGDMDKEYPIMNKKEKDVVTFGDNVTIAGAAGSDTISLKSTADAPSNWINFTGDGVGAADTISLDFSSAGAGQDTVNIGTHLPGAAGEDHIIFDTTYAGYAGTQYDDPKYYAYNFGDDPYPTVSAYPSYKNTKPLPNLKYKSQKYGEDKGIADLKDYVSSTYQGHYTNENSDVQTLDLIHSVGDAESFCRSNALKYLSRYDKKGTAKRDILKAMHYCLLLYYFSGHANDETPTRGYETF